MYSALAAAGAKVPEDGSFTVEAHQLADFQAWQARRQFH